MLPYRSLAYHASQQDSCSQHRRLRIHGGLVSPSLHTLWQAGALDSDARISTGVVLGDAALHGFVGELPPLWLTDVTQTHGPAALAALAALAETTRFVAINAAVEVDLFGQVNAGPRPGPDRHCRAPTHRASQANAWADIRRTL